MHQKQPQGNQSGFFLFFFLLAGGFLLLELGEFCGGNQPCHCVTIRSLRLIADAVVFAQLWSQVLLRSAGFGGDCFDCIQFAVRRLEIEHFRPQLASVLRFVRVLFDQIVLQTVFSSLFAVEEVT